MRILKGTIIGLRGLKYVIIEEAHIRQLILAAIIVYILAWVFGFSLMEFIILSLGLGLLYVSETTNTLAERILDFIEPKIDPRVRKIKDISASIAVFSLILFGIIFLVLIFSHIY